MVEASFSWGLVNITAKFVYIRHRLQSWNVIKITRIKAFKFRLRREGARACLLPLDVIDPATIFVVNKAMWCKQYYASITSLRWGLVHITAIFVYIWRRLQSWNVNKVKWLNPFKFSLRQGRVQSFVYFRQRSLTLAVIFYVLRHLRRWTRTLSTPHPLCSWFGYGPVNTLHL